MEWHGTILPKHTHGLCRSDGCLALQQLAVCR